MIPEQLCDVIGELSDKVLMEANEARSEKRTKRIKRRRVIYSCATMAASLAIIIGVTSVWNKPDTSMRQYPELPKLSCETSDEGYGFEGYMAFDISELVNANPWKVELEITDLPVYKNNVLYDENGIKELIYDAANKLNIDRDEVSEIKVNPYCPGKWDCDMGDIIISADEQGSVQVEYTVNKKIPDEYAFDSESTYDELEKASKYIEKEYDAIINMKTPNLNINGGDYDIYCAQSYALSYFDKSGDDIEQILNYNLNQTSFVPGDDNTMWFIRYNKPKLTEKMGDYPIITAKEAEKLLEEGHYASSAPYEFPGEKYVAKVELVYRSGNYDKYIMPYYMFYVELPEESENCATEVKEGMKCFGVYYVPAVDGRYIINLPTYNGEFN